MAGRIRGITIEIGGDTEGLVKSLKNASNASKSVQNELKDINKVLKLDPGNVDLLAQKQKILKENVEAVKNQLETEKRALEELKQAGDSAENIKAQEALQRQIAETTAKLNDAEKALEDFNAEGSQKTPTLKEKFSQVGDAISQIGGKLQEVGQQISDLGADLTKKVTVPLTAAFAYGGKSALEFEDAMAKVHTLIDDNVYSIDDLEEGLKQLSIETGKGPTELAEGLYQALSAAVDAENAVEFLDKAVGLSKAGFLDTAGAVDVLTTVINAYKMDAEDAEKISNILIQTQNDGKTTVNELSQQMGQVIPTAAAYNISLENLATGYAILTKNGINTANTTTYLNGMFTELAKDGSKVSEILKEKTGKSFGELMNDGNSLGDVLQILYDEVGGNAEAFANLWGSVTAGKGALALAQSGAGGFNEELARMENSSGNVEEALKKLDTPTAKFKKTLNELKSIALDLGQELVDLLMPAFLKLVEVVKTVRERFSNLSPEAKKLVVEIALVVAAIGPVFVVIGKVINVVGVIMTIIPKLTAAIGLIASPVGIAVAAFAALVAAGVLIYKNWDTIKAKAVEIWEAIKAFFSNTLTAIKTTFSNIWNGIKTTVTNVITGVWNTIVTIWTTIYNWLYAKISAIFNFYKSIFTGIRDTVSNIFNGIKTKVVTVWSSINTYLRDKVNAIRTNVVEKFQSIKTSLSSTFSSVWETITSPFRRAKETLEGIISRIKGFFPINLGNIFSSIRLPHFSVSGGEFPYGIGGRGSMPRFSIDWYRKAMDNGMILDGPTIFGMDTRGHFLAGGEAGSETVVGTNSLMSMIQNAVNNSGGVNASLIYEAVRQGASDATIKAYLSGRDVTDEVGRELTKIQSYNSRFQGA